MLTRNIHSPAQATETEYEYRRGHCQSPRQTMADGSSQRRNPAVAGGEPRPMDLAGGQTTVTSAGAGAANALSPAEYFFAAASARRPSFRSSQPGIKGRASRKSPDQQSEPGADRCDCLGQRWLCADLRQWTDAGTLRRRSNRHRQCGITSRVSGPGRDSAQWRAGKPDAGGGGELIACAMDATHGNISSSSRVRQYRSGNRDESLYGGTRTARGADAHAGL